MKLNNRQRWLYLEQLEGRELLNADSMFQTSPNQRFEAFGGGPSHHHETRPSGNGERSEPRASDRGHPRSHSLKQHQDRHHRRTDGNGHRKTPQQSQQVNVQQQVVAQQTNPQVQRPVITTPLLLPTTTEPVFARLSQALLNNQAQSTNSSPATTSLSRVVRNQAEGEGPTVASPRVDEAAAGEAAASQPPTNRDASVNEEPPPSLVFTSAEFAPQPQSVKSVDGQSDIDDEVQERSQPANETLALNEFLLLDQEVAERLRGGSLPNDIDYKVSESELGLQLDFATKFLAQQTNPAATNGNPDGSWAYAGDAEFDVPPEVDLELLAFDVSVRKQKTISKQVYHFTLPAGLCNVDATGILVSAATKRLMTPKTKAAEAEEQQGNSNNWLVGSLIASAAALSIYLGNAEHPRRWKRFSSVTRRLTGRDN